MNLSSLIASMGMVLFIGLFPSAQAKAQGIFPSFQKGSYWHVTPEPAIEVSDRRKKKSSTSLNGVVGPLAAKVRQIQAACGSRVVSSVRHTYIAGTRRISLHASGKAVDMVGNPSCIYSHLRGWAGGYSTDYGRVRHVHISYDPNGKREWGRRFAHGGGKKRRVTTSVASIEHATERAVYIP